MSTLSSTSSPDAPDAARNRQPVLLSEQAIEHMIATLEISSIRHYRIPAPELAADAISLTIPWGGALLQPAVPWSRISDSGVMVRAPRFTVKLNQDGRDAVSSRSIYSGEGVVSKHHTLRLDTQGQFMLKLERILAQEKCIGSVSPEQLERLQSRAAELIVERDARYLPAFLAEEAKKHLATTAPVDEKTPSIGQGKPASRRVATQPNRAILVSELKLLRAEKNTIRLPESKLSSYGEIKTLMLKAGGSYRSDSSGSFFSFPKDIDPQSLLEKLVRGESSNVKKETQFFATPEATGRAAIGKFKQVSGLRFLEPSAGDGALVDLLVSEGAMVESIENWPVNVSALKAKGYSPMERDFLSVQPDEMDAFDGVLMNPPFSNRQDIAHVRHALGFLHGKGELCAIMSPQFTQSKIKDSLNFKNLIEMSGAEVQSMDAGTFKESGTQAKTVMIHIQMPRLLESLKSRGETGEEYGLDLSVAWHTKNRAALDRP